MTRPLWPARLRGHHSERAAWQASDNEARPVTRNQPTALATCDATRPREPSSRRVRASCACDPSATRA